MRMRRNRATLPPDRSFHDETARFLFVGVILVTTSTFLTFSSDQALASHVACGDTITTDTTLDSDLIDCPNNGIVIGADDITLDLNGHTIDGDNASVDQCPEDEFCDVGILNEGHGGVRIKGGTGREFNFGVLLFDVRRNAVRNLSTVHNVSSGILLFKAARTRVRGNSAARNTGPGSGVGITLFKSDNNRIAHNRFVDNHELGIHLVRSDRNYVRRNRVRGNLEDGIILDSDGNKIVRNRVVQNSITITRFDGPRPADNVVRRNRVLRAPFGGISVDQVAKDTVLRRNRVIGSGGDGILVGGRRTTLARNKAFRSGDDGIDVRNPRTTLTRNRANRNHDLGIQAVPGVIDGGGNIARRNGDPRQCVHITCN
jgi:parallel beta-helix repeat protein